MAKLSNGDRRRLREIDAKLRATQRLAYNASQVRRGRDLPTKERTVRRLLFEQKQITTRG